MFTNEVFMLNLFSNGSTLEIFAVLIGCVLWVGLSAVPERRFGPIFKDSS
jgi:hypothetical protein